MALWTNHELYLGCLGLFGLLWGFGWGIGVEVFVAKVFGKESLHFLTFGIDLLVDFLHTLNTIFQNFFFCFPAFSYLFKFPLHFSPYIWFIQMDVHLLISLNEG